MNRYQTLLEIVRDEKPHHVVEIGTWNGRRALEFMAVSDCYYTGFDLFEDATPDDDEKEFNVKNHFEMAEVAHSLEQSGVNKFALIKGNTNETLWNTEVEPFDFCFIDGGHSVETIENDFKWVSENIQQGGTIILDDFYSPVVEGMGCNFLEDKGEKIGPKDRLVNGGSVSLLRVRAIRDRWSL